MEPLISNLCGPSVQLDNAAASPPRLEWLDVLPSLAVAAYHNPHATNGASEECMRRIQVTERQILDALKISEFDADVVWTSGGTEANNLATLGTMTTFERGVVVVESAAHSSLLGPAERLAELGYDRWRMPVDGEGRLNLDVEPPADLAKTRLFSFCHVNNETGAVQDVCEVRKWLNRHASGALLLVDALQSFTKLPILWERGRIDLLSIGGRKIGGPPDVGALIVRRGVPVKPVLFGGGQQRGLRPGTLNAVSILGFGVAVLAAMAEHEREWTRAQTLNRHLRQRLLDEFAEETPTIISAESASPYILSVGFPGYEGAILMRKLSHRGVVVGTGSACSAEAAGVSHVLTAMGVENRLARGVLRVSFSHATTEQDVDIFVSELRNVIDDY